MMQRLDGFGLLRALRAHPATASVPVVMRSALAGEEAAVEALEHGADDYLVKPFSALELLARGRAGRGTGSTCSPRLPSPLPQPPTPKL
jgi:DNA-binding response OmpR family regulator